MINDGDDVGSDGDNDEDDDDGDDGGNMHVIRVAHVSMHCI